VLRGLIGSIPPGEELEPKLEKFRSYVLRIAAAEEMEIEYRRDTINTLGSFQQEPGGKILSGALTTMRHEAFLSLLKATHPFQNWEEPSEQAVNKTEEEERLEFVEQYKKWTETGGEVVSSRIQSSDNPSSH
jgi:hypothetical protein